MASAGDGVSERHGRWRGEQVPLRHSVMSSTMTSVVARPRAELWASGNASISWATLPPAHTMADQPQRKLARTPAEPRKHATHATHRRNDAQHEKQPRRNRLRGSNSVPEARVAGHNLTLDGLGERVHENEHHAEGDHGGPIQQVPRGPEVVLRSINRREAAHASGLTSPLIFFIVRPCTR